MKIYLAGEHIVKNGQGMKIYLAGANQRHKFLCSTEGQINLLESFVYARDNKFFPELRKMPRINLILDSGAFSFVYGKGKIERLDAYVEEYISFINRYSIDLFFELDVDSCIGLDKVEKIRERLERETGKKPIPVWHLSRGKQYFLDMCDAYPYVAIGGIVGKEIPYRKSVDYFPWFIREAHLRGTKIHGLGFTSLAALRTCRFDSVDSTAWLYGNRGGFIYQFNPRRRDLMAKIQAPSGKRLLPLEAAKYNFNEWVKLSMWAERNL